MYPFSVQFPNNAWQAGSTLIPTSSPTPSRHKRLNQFPIDAGSAESMSYLETISSIFIQLKFRNSNFSGGHQKGLIYDHFFSTISELYQKFTKAVPLGCSLTTIEKIVHRQYRSGFPPQSLLMYCTSTTCIENQLYKCGTTLMSRHISLSFISFHDLQ